MPQNAAGPRTDPPESVPSASGQRPAATAAALPVLLLSLDDEAGPEVLAEAEKVEGVKMVKALSF